MSVQQITLANRLRDDVGRLSDEPSPPRYVKPSPLPVFRR